MGDPGNGIAGYDFRSGADRALAFDYNGDGKQDLFFYRPGRGAAWVARSNGDGSFTAVYAMGDPGNGIAGYNFQSGADQALAFDYNGDGKQDLFFYRPGRGAAWVARSNGDGSFTPVYAVGDDGAAGLNGIAWYDFLSGADQALAFDYNGDGKQDLFFYRPGRGAAWVARSNGDGSFTPVYAVGDDGAAGLNGIAGYDFLSGNDRAFAFDYNGDGYQDLIFYRINQAGIWIARSNGDGSFTPVNVGSDVSSFINAELAAKVANLDGETAISMEKNVFSPINLVTNKSGDVLRPLLIDQLNQELTNKSQDLTLQIDLTNDQQEQWLETNLQNYVKQKRDSITPNGVNDQTIANLQSLRLETAYLTLQAKHDPNKLQSFLEKYNNFISRPFNAFMSLFEFEVADWNKDGFLDLIGIKKNTTGTSSTEIHILSGATHFQTFLVQTGTLLHETGDNFEFKVADWNRDGYQDIIAIAKNQTGTKSTEVHIISGATGQFILNVGTILHETGDNFEFEVADWNRDGYQDIIAIAKNQTGTKSTEVHIISGATGQFILNVGTILHETGDNFEFEVADWNRDGYQDIIAIAKNQTGTKSTEVHIISGATGQFILNVGTILHETGDNFEFEVADWNRDGYQDIIAIAKNQTGTKSTEVHIISGATGQFILNVGTKIEEDNVANAINSLRNQYYPELNNPTTLATLQQQISDQQTQTQQQIDQLKNSISQKQAEAAASISQADWYQEKSAFYWEQSRKQGPTWTEWRSYKKRGLFKSKTEWTAITHVDHNWIIWDTYTKQATALRQHADQLLKGVQTDTLNKDTTTTILDQWNKANTVANEAALSQTEFIHLLQQLEAERKLSEDKIAQINDWEKLLPILQTQLQQATQDAATATTNVQKETSEYQTSKDNYLNALNSVLQKRAELQTQTQLLQQDITAAKNWAIQQTTYLADELTQTQTLITQLQTQRDLIPPTSLDNGGEENLTKKAQLDQSIQLLTQKQTVLTAQQATLTQKQTLLSTQEQVLLTQYQLLDATLASPDKDTSTLEQQLTDTRKTLAEVQKLAEQAEASSQALTAVMEDLQASLLLQNDKYLSAIKDKQQALKGLLEATELEKNYTLQATTKRQTLNGIESQLLTILKQANDAGSQEAAKLLEVANANNMATAAELYYKDYRDLASDKGGGCSGGIARPEDLLLADKYYAQMQEYRQLQQQAQQQASQFTALRQAAESQITLLDGQKALATQELAQLQQSIGALRYLLWFDRGV